MRTVFILCQLILVLPLYAQYRISGTVLDMATREPLAFVNIISADGKFGASTDIEGRFTIQSSEKIELLRISYIGYYSREYLVDHSLSRQIIYLEKGNTELETVEVLPGINPADTLMERVYANRKRNDPEKSIHFSYTSYNKLIVTLAIDSTLFLHPEKIAQLDTNKKQVIELFEKQHLFMAESVTERQFRLPDNNKETVIASRISGFQNPVFNLLATELQSFTFYREYISLGGIQYEGPVAPNASKRYFFLIEDTLFTARDTLWRVSFRPKKGKSFNGMKGVLLISSNGFALVQVIAEPANKKSQDLGIKIMQQYEFVASRQWFPVQLNTTLFFPNVEIENMELVGYANAYLSNIKIDPEQKKKNSPAYIALETDPDAGKREENFWNDHRTDSLNEKERTTYHVIDSLGKAQKLERRFNAMMYLLDGQVPIKKINLDLTRLISFNDYEGFRAGLGLRTNDRISNYFSIGGYFAYGFKDKNWKYGADLLLKIPGKDVHLNLNWQHDLEETGGVAFFERRGMNLSQDLSELYRNRFDFSDKYEAVFGCRLNKHIKVFPYANVQYRTSFPGYGQQISMSNGVDLFRDEYILAETGLGIRIQLRERLIRSGNRIISEGSNFPLIWIKFSHGTDQLASGELNYNKVDLRIEKRHRIRRMGHFSYRLQAGMVDGQQLPLGILYNPRGTWRPIRELNVVSGYGFEVMRTNEFLTDKYAALHFRYEMGSLFFKGKFKPQFIIASNHYSGSLNQQKLLLPDVKVPTGIYSESGLMVNSIIRSGISGMGIGFFYRYGNHAFESRIDNIAIKISFSFVM
ncbi:MAG: DUF5686 family protein [Flavobacteriales bacterium]